jgi:hypothetical protein
MAAPTLLGATVSLYGTDPPGLARGLTGRSLPGYNRTFEPPNPRTFEPPNPRTFDPPSLRRSAPSTDN